MKESVKLIATDLDGTLLRDDKTVSGYTKSVFARCRALGIKTVCATGRGSAERVVPLEMFDGRILMNGALAYIGAKLIYHMPIPYEAARPFLLACDARGLEIVSQNRFTHYANFPVSGEWPWITDFEIVDFSAHKKDAEKIYTMIKNIDDIAFLNERLPDETYMKVARDGLAMVMHKDATKSKALAGLERNWSIDASQTVAFGDDLNDIDLLTYAGTGIATYNALDEAKAAADEICPSNNDDGPAVWLERYIIRRYGRNQ
ncbi:MAG: HAD family hydrolase [Clostridiales bacterium]|jgi:Cof subfamily protein (haloacid dehalogenase superfamily)|nr:HAD family hydrolase [Clostridiales bacterium]